MLLRKRCKGCLCLIVFFLVKTLFLIKIVFFSNIAFDTVRGMWKMPRLFMEILRVPRVNEVSFIPSV